VVPTGHHDRDAGAEVGEGRGGADGVARDHPVPGEEEIEQVAIDQEGVAEGRDLVEEVEECLLGGGGAGAEVDILHDDELVTEHGAR
jgi:hypothetical protein